MQVEAYLKLFISVLGDWRVIAAALGTLLAWAILRYVGLIYHRAPMAQRKRKAKGPRPKRAKAAPPPSAQAEEIEEE